MQNDHVDHQAPQLNNLRPCDISINNDTDPKQAEALRKIMDEWIGGIQKDISELLTKNGITIYQITMLHPGTKSPILILSGSNYATGKLAMHAYRELRGRVAEEFSPDNL